MMPDGIDFYFELFTMGEVKLAELVITHTCHCFIHALSVYVWTALRHKCKG